MDRKFAIALARDAAVNIGGQSYTPHTAAEAETFQPHEWVIAAIEMAYAWGANDAQPVVPHTHQDTE